MDFIIIFFRDTLDGPVYYIVASICAILICSCIGYLGERYLNDKKEIEEKSQTHTEVSGRAAFDAEHNNQENAAETIQSAVAPTSEQAESVDNVEILGEGEESEEEEDPNANVNYNVTTISSDELLEDD